MRTQILLTVGMMVSLSVAACSGTDGASNEAVSGDDQDITAAQAIHGSFVLEGDTKGAYDFRPDGHFTRDTFKVLNGVFLPGHEPSNLVRDGGTYKFDAKKHVLTLHVTEGLFPGDESFEYKYEPGRILNGVFLPGHEPTSTATLVLTAIPSHPSLPAMVPMTFKSVESWCTSNTDCADEQKDGTWSPLSIGVPPARHIIVAACDATVNACHLSIAADPAANH
jgi:hypothetical protein